MVGRYADGPDEGRYADSPFVGLYQFEKKLVWIRIGADGTTSQCRIGKTGNVFHSEGTLRRGDEIHWKRTWGVDSVSLNGADVRLSGKHGSWSYGTGVKPDSSSNDFIHSR